MTTMHKFKGRLRMGAAGAGKWFAGVGMLLSIGTAQALSIAGYSSATNDRFADDPSFIGAAYDWSGVALTTSGYWGTLVSRNVFVSANHYHPANGNTFEFFPGNDPNATPITRTVSSGQRIGSSDVWVGVLDAPVPTGIATYQYATDSITSSWQFDYSSIKNKNSWMVGKGSSFSGTNNMTVGRNRLDYWFDSVEVGGTTDDAVAAENEAQGESGYVDYEAYLVGGDSGGPMLLDDGSGALKLTGINWFIGTLDNNGNKISGFSYVGNYSDDIQDYIDANPVPETGGVLVGFLLVGVMVFRRGRGGSWECSRSGISMMIGWKNAEQ